MKLSRWQALALAVIVPPALRETFLGDLLEECALHPPRAGARRWIWSQVLRSWPAMLGYRLKRGGRRARARWTFAALFLAIASLQAWDSRVHESTPLVIGIVAFAIVLASGACLLSTRTASFAAASLAGGLLLIVARVISPTPLREVMIPIVVTLPMLIHFRAGEASGSSEPRGPQASS